MSTPIETLHSRFDAILEMQEGGEQMMSADAIVEYEEASGNGAFMALVNAGDGVAAIMSALAAGRSRSQVFDMLAALPHGRPN